MNRIITWVAVALLLSFGLGARSAQDEGKDAQPLQVQHAGDITFLSGGVGRDEQQAIAKKSGAYNFELTLTRPDGAYLAGVDLTVQNTAGKSVLDTTTQGPILLAEMPPGHYWISATTGSRKADRREIDVPQQGATRIILALPERTAQG